MFIEFDNLGEEEMVLLVACGTLTVFIPCVFEVREPFDFKLALEFFGDCGE